MQDNVDKFSLLPCVSAVTGARCAPVAHLDPNATKGSLTVHAGEYLVQYASGLWQRYGAEAYNRLIRTPNEY